MNVKWNCGGISRRYKALDKETDKKGDEEVGRRWNRDDNGLEQFYKRFPFATGTR